MLLLIHVLDTCFSHLSPHIYVSCKIRSQPWLHTPDSKVHGANMWPTWILSAPDGPHVGPMNLGIRVSSLWTCNRLALVSVEGCLSWSGIQNVQLDPVKSHHPSKINILRPRQYGCHLSDNTLIRIFLNENVWIFIKTLPKCIPTGPINNIPSMVQIMAWRWAWDKPLSEPMMVTSHYLNQWWFS